MTRIDLQNVMAISLSEAARQLGVSPRTVATLVAAGDLLSRTVGRRRLIPVRALEDFLRQDHVTSGKRGDVKA